MSDKRSFYRFRTYFFFFINFSISIARSSAVKFIRLTAASASHGAEPVLRLLTIYPINDRYLLKQVNDDNSANVTKYV